MSGAPHIDAWDFFREYCGRPELVLEEPRQGCNSRAQLISEWLANTGITERKYIVARSTLAPRAPFVAPIRDKNGRRFPLATVCRSQPGQEFYFGVRPEQEMQWRYHIAVCARGQKSYIVFDPALFDGPVVLSQWKAAFRYNPEIYFTSFELEQGNFVYASEFIRLPGKEETAGRATPLTALQQLRTLASHPDSFPAHDYKRRPAPVRKYLLPLTAGAGSA